MSRSLLLRRRDLLGIEIAALFELMELGAADEKPPREQVRISCARGDFAYDQPEAADL
jgi:hypothetical protein